MSTEQGQFYNDVSFYIPVPSFLFLAFPPLHQVGVSSVRLRVSDLKARTLLDADTPSKHAAHLFSGHRELQ